MKKNIRKHFSAFTLIELLVVISIITILLSILMPSLRKAKMLAARLKCTSNLKQIDLAMNMYLNNNDNTYPCKEDVYKSTWLWMGRGWRPFIEPELGGNIDANNPSVLFCPQDKTSKDKYESTSYSYSMSFYHSPGQIDSLNDKKDTWEIHPLPSIKQKDMNVAKPYGKIIIGEWSSNHSPIEDDSGWWCWEGTRNYLFVDGHINSLKATEIRAARDGFPDANLTFSGIKGTDWPATKQANELK